MSFLVDSKLETLGLDKEVAYLKTLAKLAKHWNKLNDALPGDNNFEDIVDLVLSFDEHRSAIEPILVEADVDANTLAEIVGKIRSKYDEKIPQRAQQLLAPMSDFAALDDEVILSWSFLTLDESRSAALGDSQLGFDIGLATNASLEIEPGDEPDFDSDDLLLRLAFFGEVAASIGIGGKSKWGPVSIGAAAEHMGSLTYWFGVPAQAQQERLIQKLADSLGDIANPFDLDSIHRATGNGLDRLLLTTSLELRQNLSVQFNIAPMMTSPRIVENKISFSASATRRRRLEIEAYRDGDDLSVRLARSKLRLADSRSQWSFGIDVSDIALQVKDYVAKLAAEIEEFKKEYGDLLSPGTWLKENAAELLDEFTAELTDAQEQIDALKESVVDELDGGKQLLTGEVADVLSPIAEKLKEILPQESHPKIDAELAGLLDKLSGKIDAAIIDRVEATLAKSDRVTKAFFKRIDKLRETVQDKVDDVATKADNATARVREILGALEQAVAKLTKALQKAATAKLEIRLWHEESVRAGVEAEATLKFKTVDDNTAGVYERLLKGEVGELKKLLANPDPDIEIEPKQFREFLERSVEDGVAISVLGFELGETDVFNSEAVITVDKDGNVLVHATASRAREIRSPRAAQQVAFVSQFELWSATQSSNASLTISATQEDKNLKVKEIEDLLDDLVRVGLITGQVFEHAVALVEQQAQRGRKLRATVDLRLAMLDDEVDELLAASGPIGEDGSVIERVLDVLEETGAYRRKAINAAARSARSALRPKSLGKKLKGKPLIEAFEHFQPVPTGRAAKKWRQFAELEFARTHDSARLSVSSDAPRALRNAQRIHRLVKGYGVLLRTMAKLSEMDPTSADTDEIDAAHKVINLCLTSWLRVSRAFVTHPQDELHENALAFLVLLATDAGLPVGLESESAVSVAITFAGEDGPHLIA